MKIFRMLIVIQLVCPLFFMSVSQAADVLKMGYRTNERPPLIGEAPDNSGLYLDLYSQAARKTGIELVVVRKPKKRILNDLKSGDIDFYPGFNFSTNRAEYTYYMENGLPGGDVGISRSDLPPVTRLEQLKGMTLLNAVGAADFLKGIEGVYEDRLHELTIEKAVQLIRFKRADFYIYDRSSLEYYLRQNNIRDIRVHPDCCGGEKPMYLGFSRKSPLFGEKKNPAFDPSAPVSVDNFPTVLLPDSIAFRLATALAEMKAAGETRAIYDRYHQIE